MTSSSQLSATIRFPEELPVSERRAEIMEALQAHQVVIVAGETGSGKTTQLPKMCLALGFGDNGMIGHTQPRRLAARSVAERIAEELGEDLGHTVGYQVRFTAEVSKSTRLKLMTDGILLAEIQHDPLLKKYSVIIIDEAHERSLNIDFLLGYLKRLLPQRPDLKLIITSATIDPESFAEHFATEQGEEMVPAKIIEVSGRTYPVEIRYRPLSQPELEDDPDDDADDHEEARDPLDAVADAVLELAKEPPGDILIFFPGEQEINDAAEVIAQRIAHHRQLASAQVLPLFGRLSMADQQRVFRPSNHRRIVLATNVAETSLTVPGIKYVIDTGTARISRYSQRTKVQRLPIERISQASANQRSGRAGRVSSGIAIRLYSQEDFEQRPQFTDPEILRTSLASVILSMLRIGVAKTPEDVEDFPFLQPPQRKQISDGVNLLIELGALNTDKPVQLKTRGGKTITRTFPRGTITPIGRKISELPVDPRLARMILEAARLGSVNEVIIVAAGLTIQDPRERPTEKRAQADQLHARFSDENSDFSALLNLWNYVTKMQSELSGNQFRKLCRTQFINYMRIREWQELVGQLKQLAKQVGVNIKSTDVDPVGHHETIHQAILSGLLSHIGSYQEKTREYSGARSTRFAVFPGSGLFKKKHPFVMAAELVETSRLWARQVAKVEPEWVEQAAGNLAKRSFSDPYWSSRQASAMTKERVTVYGVMVVVDRPVHYYRINRGSSREMFIQHALVEGDWNTRHRFFARNQQKLAEIDELETRLRRRDLKISDEAIFEFYDQRIPEHVVSGRHFDKWWNKKRREDGQYLDLDPQQLITTAPEDLDTEKFPEVFVHPIDTGNVELALEYAFHPIALSEQGQRSQPRTDGVTVSIPVEILHQMKAQRFDWLIPGLREELLTALIRGLPKPVRKNLVPAPNTATLVNQRLDEEYDPLRDDFFTSVGEIIRREKYQAISAEDWDTSKLPEHLRFTYRVVGPRGEIMGTGDELGQLQRRLAQQNQTALARSLTAALGTGTQPVGHDRPTHPRGGSEKAAKSPAKGRSQLQPRSGISTWDLGDLPTEMKTQFSTGRSTQLVTGYPALKPAGRDQVELVILRTHGEQLLTHRQGVISLLQANLPDPGNYLMNHLSAQEKLVFTRSKHGTVESLVRDAMRAAIDSLVPEKLPFTEKQFSALLSTVRRESMDRSFETISMVHKILATAHRADQQLRKVRSLSLSAAVLDMRAQLDELIKPDFIAETGYQYLRHIPRYVEGIIYRLEKLNAGGHLQRDGLNMQVVQGLERRYADLLDAWGDAPAPGEVSRIRWLFEELRISFFAQELTTAVSVSEKKIKQELNQAAKLLN